MSTHPNAKAIFAAAPRLALEKAMTHSSTLTLGVLCLEHLPSILSALDASRAESDAWKARAERAEAVITAMGKIELAECDMRDAISHLRHSDWEAARDKRNVARLELLRACATWRDSPIGTAAADAAGVSK
jgi:DNA-binding IclR family transcriptional regulator